MSKYRKAPGQDVFIKICGLPTIGTFGHNMPFDSLGGASHHRFCAFCLWKGALLQATGLRWFARPSTRGDFVVVLKQNEHQFFSDQWKRGSDNNVKKKLVYAKMFCFQRKNWNFWLALRYKKTLFKIWTQTDPMKKKNRSGKNPRLWTEIRLNLFECFMLCYCLLSCKKFVKIENFR